MALSIWNSFRRWEEPGVAKGDRLAPGSPLRNCRPDPQRGGNVVEWTTAVKGSSAIRMKFFGASTVGALDGLRVGGFGDAEGLVEVGHCILLVLQSTR